MQYGSKEELKQAIQKSWEKLSADNIQKLYDSMSKRCMSVAERGGRKV